MDIVWEYLKDIDGHASSYAIAAFIILLWWVARSFHRLYHQATDGPDRLTHPETQERPRRRLPLQ